MFTSLQASTHSTCSARHEQETSFGLLLSKEASKQTTTAGKARTSEDFASHCQHACGRLRHFR